MGPVSDLTCCMRPPVCPQFQGLTTARGSHNLQPGLHASLGSCITGEHLPGWQTDAAFTLWPNAKPNQTSLDLTFGVPCAVSNISPAKPKVGS